MTTRVLGIDCLSHEWLHDHLYAVFLPNGKRKEKGTGLELESVAYC